MEIRGVAVKEVCPKCGSKMAPAYEAEDGVIIALLEMICSNPECRYIDDGSVDV